MDNPNRDDVGASMSDMPPSMQQNVAILKAVVIGLGVLIVLALGVLVVTLISRMNARAPNSTTNIQIALPADATVIESHLDQGKLVLRLKIDGQEMIRLYDPVTGSELGSISLKPGIRP